MKTRVTVTVDPKVVAQAKSFAHARRTNLSALVEELLENATSTAKARKPSFTQKWRGKVSAKPADPDDELLTALRAKYGLAEKNQ